MGQATPGGDGVNLFGFGRRRSAGRAAELKGWVAARLDLAADHIMTVAQLACLEPGCPPLETVVRIDQRGKPMIIIRVPKALADVTDEDIAAAIGNGTGRGAP